MKRELGEIRKVFKKTKNVIIAEPQTTTITGKKPKLSENQISVEEARFRNSSGKQKENKEIKNDKKEDDKCLGQRTESQPRNCVVDLRKETQ